jgi:hypothetical protein
MGHDHSHDDPKAYYVEQLCTIGIAGALGGIAVMLYTRGLLWFLAEKVQPWVLGGGIALLVLVAVRATVVWIQAGRKPVEDHYHDHEHDHGHGSACDHDHDHAHGHGHGHSHGGDADHGHEHGWAPWRFVILLIPVVLYFLDLPNKSMARADIRDAQVYDVQAHFTGTGEKPIAVEFKELQNVSLQRDYYAGKIIRVKAEYLPGNKDMFSLVRYRMNCCARDAVPLKAVILVDWKTPGSVLPEQEMRKYTLEGKWLEVTGQLQFKENPAQPGSWLTIIVLRPDEGHPLFDATGQDDNACIKVVDPDSNYYLTS